MINDFSSFLLFLFSKDEEKFHKEFEKQNEMFQEFLHRQMMKHQNEMEIIVDQHQRKFDEEQNQFDKKEKYLNEQIDFLKCSFHSFKVFLSK